MTHVPYPGCYCADCVEGAKPIGYINAEMLNRKIEFEANGMVMFDRPCGAATMPIYAETPSARITGDKDRSVQSRAPTHPMTTVSQEAREAEVTVREIETVTGDFLTEAGEPFYRIEINGYCADFDYREAAENFANAINQMVARHRHQAERETLARMEPVAWMYEYRGGVVAVTATRYDRGTIKALGYVETPLYALPPAPEAV